MSSKIVLIPFQDAIYKIFLCSQNYRHPDKVITIKKNVWLTIISFNVTLNI